MELQLYMWSGERRMILERHDFYVAQVKARVFAQFQDLEGEAERYSDAEYDRLGSLPGDENSDMGAIAEAAIDRGQEFYSLLSDLKKQMLLGALAGLYHQWDKDLRDFVERELSHYFKSEAVMKIAWDPNVGNVFDVLKQFGWDCRVAPFFAKINACRLIVNVYKHGRAARSTSWRSTIPSISTAVSPTSRCRASQPSFSTTNGWRSQKPSSTISPAPCGHSGRHSRNGSILKRSRSSFIYGYETAPPGDRSG
jgi:hypothetical protein